VKTAVVCSVPLGALILALPMMEVPVAARRTPWPQHAIIAASGAAAPTAGHYLPLFSNARLNARGEVAFDAVVDGRPFTSGVFVSSGGSTSTIALGDNPDPAEPSFGEVANPFITPSGDVVFQANGAELFTRQHGRVAALARDGDQAPGGGTLTPSSTFAVNDHGDAVYSAAISGANATQGLFRTDGRHTVAIVRDDSEVPTGGRFVGVFAGPAINDRGEVAFFAEMTGGAADFGIFRGDGGRLTPVLVANQIAPGGATFDDFSDPVINQSGHVAAVALLSNGASSAGLFVADGRNAVAIALQGQPAPGGGSYRAQDAFVGPFRLNDADEVAFTARLTGTTSLSGVFRGNGHRTTAIALAATNAPGTTGTFQSFDDIRLGRDGRVALIATLTIGVGGVDASNSRGIWTGTSEADLRLVARTGEVIAGQVLTRLPSAGLNSRLDTNQAGVLWIGDFGRGKAIVLSRVPGGNDDGGDRD
jgi:hypothetical protein